MANKTTYSSILGLCFVFILIQLSGCSTPRQPSFSSRTGLDPQELHSEVVTIAREMLGQPYHYGGDSPRQGFDCSGLVYYAHLQAGLRLPRTSYGQFKATRPIAMRHLHPGDLVFFRFRRDKISHVGIYIGHHRFIHAPSSGKDVTIDDLNDPYWHYRFVRGGRTL